MNRRILLALLAALALAGCAKTTEPVPDTAAPAPELPVQAEPPKAVEPPLHFAVYGDCRSRPEKHREVVAQMLQFKPQFVIQTGDLVGGDGQDKAEWTQAYDIITPLWELGPYYMAMGNHDRGNPDFAEQLDLPVAQAGDTWYTFARGRARFFVLNTNTIRLADEGDEQVAWFKAALAAATEPYTFVVMHHPPYSIGSYKPGDITVRQRLCPIAAEHHVTAVFCGHDHGYYRTVRDGVPYLITAGGGAPLYDQDPSLAQDGDVYQKTLHFLGLDETEHGFECRAIDETGAEFDRFTLPLAPVEQPTEPATVAEP